MKKLVLLFLLIAGVNAKEFTPNDVFFEMELIKDEIHHILKYFKIEHNHKNIINRIKIDAELQPRNVWQKTYEILIKINILREQNGYPIVEPVNITAMQHLNPNLVYEQTQRILTELKIFRERVGIETPKYSTKKFSGKTPLDVFIGLSHISASFDELNKGGVTASFVFAENMRVYDDISLILMHLNVEDKTIPAKKNINATPNDTFETAMKILEKIKQLQISIGIKFVDFNTFRKQDYTPGEVFEITQMIIAELQTIKAYMGIDKITPAASIYAGKTPAEVDQLMSWNFRKLELIKLLNAGK